MILLVVEYSADPEVVALDQIFSMDFLHIGLCVTMKRSNEDEILSVALAFY